MSRPADNGEMARVFGGEEVEAAVRSLPLYPYVDWNIQEFGSEGG